MIALSRILLCLKSLTICDFANRSRAYELPFRSFFFTNFNTQSAAVSPSNYFQLDMCKMGKSTIVSPRSAALKIRRNVVGAIAQQKVIDKQDPKQKGEVLTLL